MTVTVPLGEISETMQGGKLKLSGKHFVDKGFPAYGAGGMNGYLEVAEFDQPAIVLSAIGARCGKCFLAEGQWTSLANTRLIFPNHERVDIRYLWYHLNDEESWPRSGAAQPFIRPADVKSRSIPLPPLEEQQRIVAVLDEAFEGLARARAHAEANLQNARELFDEAEAKLFRDISNGSTETTLGEIASFRNGLNYSRTSRGDEVKVVGVGDFQDNFIIPTETLSSTKIDGQLSEDDKLLAGDILAVRSNGNRELIGRTMLMPEPNEPTSFSGFSIRIRLEDKNILPEYVCSYLRTKDAR